MSAEFPMIDPPLEFANHCDKRGAERLKARIEQYWRERGHIVSVTLEQKGFAAPLRSGRWDVRSDLLNGLPRPPAVEQRRAA